ncbi:hypothetical protein DNTS_024181 [Danionella cerebrum]|uniref:Ubiquitin-like protein 3 n=1 Tax=Danionella cerebrum TaxID=2873325 RepID=A0A553RIL1_9TELE|nr:hypothetical protein DNTS_024181 [Danionella translucida]
MIAFPFCPSTPPPSLSLAQVNLRLILVSGKTQDFTFSPNDSATDIARYVFENWPVGWEEESVSSPSILRLIFQGRFLHGNVTLGALKLPPGRTTVMHLVARETLPEPNSHGTCFIYWPEEPGENHREQLLSTAVKPRPYPPSHMDPPPPPPLALVSAHQPGLHLGRLLKISTEKPFGFSFRPVAKVIFWIVISDEASTSLKHRWI